MSLVGIYLQDFLVAAPTCVASASVADFVERCCQEGADRLVIVDVHRRPVGSLRLTQVLHQVLHQRDDTDAIGDRYLAQLEPLMLVSAQWTLQQLLAHLVMPMPIHYSYGLIDASGRYIGLLDIPRLMQVLLANSNRLASSPAIVFNPLLNLIERLPLPLMLQTTDGQVVAQNLVWRQQLSQLQNPDSIWTEAAVWLSSEVSNLVNSSDPSSPLSTAANTSLCQQGSQPDSCICQCPLQNGQERVFQFIKVPLGSLLSDISRDYAASSKWSEAAEIVSTSSFRLATLLPATDASAIDTATESLWLVLAQDVTEQQQLAKELTAKNADLIQLNRLKDEFLACISHELKTPLTAVLGLSSLLKDQSLGELNQRQAHYARLIHQSGRHLMAVVNDILDLTRIETGQLELGLEPVDIIKVCRRAFGQVRQLRTESDAIAAASTTTEAHSFSLDVEAGLTTLIADELRLRQMLVQLLSNAVKFTEPGKPIGLKVNRWGGWVAFTVWDTGIGIPADRQHLIFQKFQQLEDPLTRRYEGTGLGLVLTQRLARLHGGDVTFLSKEGHGSQFTILLPPSPPDHTHLTTSTTGLVAPSPLLPSSYAAEPSSANDWIPLHVTPQRGDGAGAISFSDAGLTARSPVRNRLMLIVEAAHHYIDQLANLLVGLGYRVAIARSGTEALEKARRLQPCFIFLNPFLPLLSGWDVLTLLKSDPLTQHIPIITTATQGNEEQSARNHADGFLSLPVQIKALQQIIRQRLLAPEFSQNTKPLKHLTILRLSPDQSLPASPLQVDLTQLLHAHQCRVLEADDLEQAELLARVWKPNVVLIDTVPVNPAFYFQQLSHHTVLASLPLITLKPEATQAANHVAGLLVFPCLAAPEVASKSGRDSMPQALVQVIQVAAGYAWRPEILAVDLALVLQGSDRDKAVSEVATDALEESQWLQALVQYLQTAGFQTAIGHSWADAMQQVESGGVDLLLLCWTEARSASNIATALARLQIISPRPPILVLDHRQETATDTALTTVMQHLAVHVLPPATPMDELLAEIHSLLQRHLSH